MGKMDAIAASIGTGLLEVNPLLDPVVLAPVLQSERRLRIDNFLVEDSARRLHKYLDTSDDWWHLINTPDGIVELADRERHEVSREREAEIDAIVGRGLQHGFQYRYRGIQVPDPQELDAPEDALDEFAMTMAGRRMLDLLERIIGCGKLRFRDGQATLYTSGDLLTAHDDNVAGKRRVAAFVLGLTPVWRLEWGGLLLFHAANRQGAEALVPRFNTLDLFLVPQVHSVSAVVPGIDARRFAVTGWLEMA